MLAAYFFLVARSSPAVAALSALGFFGVSIVPLHAVYLTSETFNAACVTFAYFCWCYKEVAPPRRDRWTAWLWRPTSDVVAAGLLGLATFSKPSHALLIAPVVLLAAGRRRLRHGSLIAVVFVAVVAAGFGLNLAVTGELNYQGGDRKIFYGTYPFEQPGATFDSRGISMTTNAVDEEAWRVGFLSLMPRNLGYFLVGRHFGLLPFFFPGVVAIALFLAARRERLPWHWWTLGAVALSVVVLSGTMPYTWSGGGGPPGNRYFLSIYPVLLFLTPPMTSFVPAIVAWAGGAAFVAHILMNPFVAAKQPYLSPERGLLRALPVELTMVDDLPISLDRFRHRLEYRSDPDLLLSLLDRNVQRSGPLDLWVAGKSRADIIVRSGQCLSSMEVTLRSPVANRVTVRFGGDEATTDLGSGSRLGSCSLRPVCMFAAGGSICCRSEPPPGSFRASLCRARATSGFSARSSPCSRASSPNALRVDADQQLIPAEPEHSYSIAVGQRSSGPVSEQTLEGRGRPGPLYRSIDGEAVPAYALLVAAEWKRVAARQNADAARFRHAKGTRPRYELRASAVVAEEYAGRVNRPNQPVDQDAASGPPFPEGPGKHYDRVQPARSPDNGGKWLTVANLRVAAERQDFQAFGGDDLAPGDQQQPRAGIALGHQALRLAGLVKRPDVAGNASGRVTKPPKIVHARRFGEQQPPRILGRRPASARGAPEIGERAVEEAITVEARVVVNMAVYQERPADDVRLRVEQPLHETRRRESSGPPRPGRGAPDCCENRALVGRAVPSF